MASGAANNAPAAGDVLVSHNDREREYQSIQQEADVLQRQINLVRRIVSFAMPSVVHIEAARKPKPTIRTWPAVALTKLVPV